METGLAGNQAKPPTTRKLLANRVKGAVHHALRERTEEEKKIGKASTDRSRKRFRWSAVLAVIGFVLLLVVTTYGVDWWFRDQGEASNLYFSLATALIISWMVVLIAFYIWAMQFYNVNHGWSMNAWKRLEVNAEKNQELKALAPSKNPHEEQTLGLPNGTIRGTIAISLMVGGLAMMVASMGMKSTLKPNTFFIDNFDFFKTAFLMMIAFYFGNKSLDFLKDRKKVIATGSVPEENPKKDPDFEDKNATG